MTETTEQTPPRGTDGELAAILGEGFQIVACTRVWEAWQVGTMTEDDFIPAAESDLPAELIAWRDAAVTAECERIAALLQAEADSRYGAADASTNGGRRPPLPGHVAAAGAFEYAAELSRHPAKTPTEQEG